MKPGEANTSTAGLERRAFLRDHSYAWTASILLHAILLAITLLFFLPSPEKQKTEVELRFEKPSPAALRETEVPAGRNEAISTTAPPRPLMETRVPSAPLLPDLSVPRVQESEREAEQTFSLPTTPLERDWTPEEAYAELTRLLEEYPQFRETVLREMIAGKGFAPDTVQRIDLYLDRMLANGINPSWNRQRSAVEGAFRSYDGVSGWRQNSNYGGGINVIGLLRFLYDLIEGE
ncbi:MAG: hypothetical protein RRA94_05335 [Bacteroidota bacterium]|nr:hypothetical protein [Bacteroidota bacterium]